jgi:hypothetical protein
MPVTPTEALLPYVVDLWTTDQQRVQAVLATAASLSIARMAFDAAVVCYPDRYLTLTGPGADEEWRPKGERREERAQAGRGWTNDLARRVDHAVR